jgi:hypothetical protein
VLGRDSVLPRSPCNDRGIGWRLGHSRRTVHFVTQRGDHRCGNRHCYANRLSARPKAGSTEAALLLVAAADPPDRLQDIEGRAIARPSHNFFESDQWNNNSTDVIRKKHDLGPGKGRYHP